jgi:hypothetical protein
LGGGRGFHVEPFFLGSTVGLLLQDSGISSLLTSLQSDPVRLGVRLGFCLSVLWERQSKPKWGSSTCLEKKKLKACHSRHV